MKGFKRNKFLKELKLLEEIDNYEIREMSEKVFTKLFPHISKHPDWDFGEVRGDKSRGSLTLCNLAVAFCDGEFSPLYVGEKYF